jgi:hypothetical protein
MRHFYKSFILLTTLFLVACGSSNDEHLDLNEETKSESNSHQEYAKKVFNSIPDPLVLTQIINDAQLEYQPELLNDPIKYNAYNLEQDKALNLGVYGTDLSYASMFEQTQECLTYLKCVNQLCKSLGINGVFDEKTSDRIEENKSNKDSLLAIISGSFSQADEYLTKNKRGNFSTLIITGGWIEGIYLASALSINSKNEQAIFELAKHHETLTSIIKLLDSYESISGEIEKMRSDLKLIQPIFTELTANNLTIEKKLEIINRLHQKIKEIRQVIIE